MVEDEDDVVGARCLLALLGREYDQAGAHARAGAILMSRAVRVIAYPPPRGG